MATIGILNVGAGDTKLVFDSDNPAECIRSGRIVTDMLRRGYALLIELPDGTFTRVHEFNAAVCEYIIADFDPVQAAAADAGVPDAQAQPPAAPPVGTPSPGPAEEPRRPGLKRGTRAIKATGASGVAVARSAGG